MLTYNIHHGADATNRPDLPRIAATIAGAEPDLVCLQEVDRRWGRRSLHADQIAELSERLGMQAHFRAALTRGTDGRYGNAVLSPHPVTASAGVWLPTPAGLEPRRAAVARVALPSGPVTAVSVHLTVGPRLREVRTEQQHRLVELLSTLDGPVVVAGDFNTGRTRRDLSVLNSALRYARPRRPSPRHWSALWGRPAGATHPVRWPTRRIDRVYVSAEWTVVTVRVLPSRASDHRALLAVLRT